MTRSLRAAHNPIARAQTRARRSGRYSDRHPSASSRRVFARSLRRRAVVNANYRRVARRSTDQQYRQRRVAIRHGRTPQPVKSGYYLARRRSLPGKW